MVEHSFRKAEVVGSTPTIGCIKSVTGAFMVIGLKYGRTRTDDREAKMKTAQKEVDFAEKFKARHGSIDCTELIGCNIGTMQGYEEAKKKDLFKQLCPKYVISAAEI